MVTSTVKIVVFYNGQNIVIINNFSTRKTFQIVISHKIHLMAWAAVTFGKAMNKPRTRLKIKCIQPILNLYINDSNIFEHLDYIYITHIIC